MKNIFRFLKHHTLLLLMILASCDVQEPFTEEPITIADKDSYVFTSDENGKYDIWKKDKNEVFSLTSNDEKDSWWPRPNVSRTKILYYESNIGRDVNDYSSATLMVMDADGSNSKALIILGEENDFIGQGLANWSYDETKIVFTAITPTLNTWQIYQYNLQDESIIRISIDSTKTYLDPIYSLDDQSVFCIATAEDDSLENKNEIFEIDIKTGSETRITNNQTRDHHPSLSPDGNFLVFESLVDSDYLSIGKWDIMIFDLNTQVESTLIGQDGIRIFPNYSSDGNTIYFTEFNLETASLCIGAFQIDSGEFLDLESTGNNSLNVSHF